jgi:light-regulated signal transduction histidine kinase (bacteriophytochrome)
LERSNRDLAQFAFVASHDLQEPLRMVTSYLQLLARRYQGRLDTDADEYIAFAVDGAARMKRLISDLLAYSRVTTRGVAFGPVDLDRTLALAKADLAVAMVESGAVVEAGPLPTILGDEGQLGQLLRNLVGNAIKYRRVDPVHITVTATRTEEGWQIAVRDNGIGFDMQYADRIFGIFTRLHTREEHEGSGIGLAICRRIVERHGGRIWAESEPDVGTKFCFTLPER